MDFTVQVNWLPSILLVMGSLLVLLNFRKLKSLFNEGIGFKGKQFIFGLILLAPFSLLFGLASAHSNYKFLTNWERQVEECIAGSELAEPTIISVEKDGGTFIKLKNKLDDETIWCHHNYEEIVEYF